MRYMAITILLVLALTGHALADSLFSQPEDQRPGRSGATGRPPVSVDVGDIIKVKVREKTDANIDLGLEIADESSSSGANAVTDKLLKKAIGPLFDVIGVGDIAYDSSTDYKGDGKTDRKVRVPVDVGVSYASTPEDVRTILLEVAARHGLVLKDPAPTVFFTGFGDSSLDFKLLIWINDPPRSAQISSDLRFMIFREFARRGIEIPFPQRDIHLRSDVRLASSADRQTASTSSDATQAAASGQAAGTGKRTSSGQDAQEI